MTYEQGYQPESASFDDAATHFANLQDFMDFAEANGQPRSFGARAWWGLATEYVRQRFAAEGRLPGYESAIHDFPVEFEDADVQQHGQAFSVREVARGIDEGLDLDSLETYLSSVADFVRGRTFNTARQRGAPLPPNIGEGAVHFLHRFLRSRDRHSGDFSGIFADEPEV
jgi:hypothetical protein